LFTNDSVYAGLVDGDASVVYPADCHSAAARAAATTTVLLERHDQLVRRTVPRRAAALLRIEWSGWFECGRRRESAKGHRIEPWSALQ